MKCAKNATKPVVIGLVIGGVTAVAGGIAALIAHYKRNYGNLLDFSDDGEEECAGDCEACDAESEGGQSWDERVASLDPSEAAALFATAKEAYDGAKALYDDRMEQIHELEEIMAQTKEDMKLAAANISKFAGDPVPEAYVAGLDAEKQEDPIPDLAADAQTAEKGDK